jgi:hypothetical protein
MLKHSAQIGALALFAVVVVFLGYILWRSLFPTYRPNDDDSGQNKQYAQQQRSDENSEIRSQKSVADENIATYTLALAIFTALLVLISVFQIAFLIRSDDIATKTAQSAKDSAEASIRSISIAKAVQRAQVFVEKIDTVSLFDGDTLKLFHFIANSKNMGVTPAVNMSVAMQFSVVNYGEDIVFSGDPVFDRIGVSIGPGVTFKSLLPIDVGILNAVYAKEKRLGIVFILEFSDIFDVNSRHQTEFASEVIASINPMNIKRTTAENPFIIRAIKYIRQHE